MMSSCKTQFVFPSIFEPRRIEKYRGLDLVWLPGEILYKDLAFPKVVGDLDLSGFDSGETAVDEVEEAHQVSAPHHGRSKSLLLCKLATNYKDQHLMTLDPPAKVGF